MVVEVVNRQRQRAVPTDALRRLVGALVNQEPPPAGRQALAVALVSDRTMRELNRVHRGIDRTTDVLAFPDGEDGYLGDIVVSVPRAVAQAREAGHPLARELAALVVHGYLHLLGYDHESDRGRMMRRQSVLLRRLLKRGGER